MRKQLCILIVLSLIFGLIALDREHLKAVFLFQQIRYCRCVPIVTYLAHSPHGIRLALADFNILGGETCEWSSQILLDSDSPVVHDELEKILSSTSEPLIRRLEAANLLWEREKQLDALVSMFDLVKDGGDNSVVRIGREILQINVAEHIGKAIDFSVIFPSGDRAISLPSMKTSEQFRAFLTSLFESESGTMFPE